MISPPNTILRLMVGSQAYGLNLENGDIDEKGVCVESLSQHVGFTEFEQFEFRTAAVREGKHDAKSQSGDLDLTIYSLKKFLRLALKGNPTVIEMLFIKDYIEVNDLGFELQDLYPEIVSKQCGKAYLGYMFAQRQRLLGERGGMDVNRNDLVEKHGFDTKYAMHALRLGFQGIELMSTGYLRLPHNESDRTYLLDVRRGFYSLEQVTKRLDDLEKWLKDLLIASTIPDHPNTQVVEKWMLNVYLERWEDEEI